METGAIGIVAVAAVFILARQWIIQGRDHERAMRRQAYESAMLHWKTLIENKMITGNEAWKPNVFFDLHLALAKFVIAGPAPEHVIEINSATRKVAAVIMAHSANPLGNGLKNNPPNLEPCDDAQH